MTAPFIAEAERLAAEALRASIWAEECPHDGPDGDPYGPCLDCGAAAVVPILAEHFAQAVEAERARIHVEYERGLFRYGDAVEPGSRDPFAEAAMDALDDAARVIREVATPTEGGTA